MLDIKNLRNKNSQNFFLIAGPCVVENKEVCFEIAKRVKEITEKLEIPYIFKASYKKANRSKLDSFTGIGDLNALEIIKEVGEHFQLPTLTDIHESKDAEIASQYVDVLQIPAFLCRQTDLLTAAANTGRYVNIKKGQFLSGEAMSHAVEKVKMCGNDHVMVTDRGNSFGYTDIIVDYRNITAMKKFGVPVIMDITHSLQQPNQSSGVTGGRPDLIETIAKAAIAVGADGLFIETHPNPSKALSDGANMLHLDKLEELLVKLIKIRKAIL